MTWREVCLDVIWERGAYCEVCGSPEIDNPHHAVIFRIAKFKKWLDVKFNLVILCRTCHAQAHSEVRHWRRKCWEILCRRYGREVMISWMNSLPLKVIPLTSELEDVI